MGWQDAPLVEGGGKAAWESAPVVGAPKKPEGSVLGTVARLASPAGTVAALFSEEGRADLKNAIAGGARGAGSIGATVMYPIDKTNDLIEGRKELGPLSKLVVGKDYKPPLSRNEERRAAMDSALQEMGADSKAPAFQVGKIATEVGGTSGVGATLAAGAKALGVAAPVVEALASGGMSAGGAKGVAGLAARTVGGAATGGASAGLIEPHAAGEGALIGGLLPVGVKGAGAVMDKVGAATAPSAAKVAADAAKLESARTAGAAGYVLPPADIPGTGVVTRALGGLSGKIKTAQVASERNQVVTDKLARKALGLDEGAELTADVLQGLRKKAGGAYEVVRGSGEVTSDPAFLQTLDRIASVSKGAARSFPGLKENGVEDLIAAVRQPKFDAGDAIDATMLLREQADKAFRQGDTTVGRAAKTAATALEDQLERHLTASGNPDAVKAFQEARKQIAKTYTVQKALNPETGGVTAAKLAKDLEKGRPLSGELEQVARVSSAFPKATQMLKEAPGSTSPLDWLFAATAGMGHPLGAASVLARPAAREAILSRPAQSMMMKPPGPPGPVRQLIDREGLTAIGRALPVLGSSP